MIVHSGFVEWRGVSPCSRVERRVISDDLVTLYILTTSRDARVLQLFTDTDEG